ncbi:hypothetical protein ANCCAN_18247 [Ancylostoma caninum]|uniref:Uncharacterized protein n=1 Tax=Ancylostoma caninum TaxID=29170 RepID=A0A368FUL6_ANCCA|nr:hypothetical protein ANCCAN_18247 [Ancylostoma caninum]
MRRDEKIRAFARSVQEITESEEEEESPVGGRVFIYIALVLAYYDASRHGTLPVCSCGIAFHPETLHIIVKPPDNKVEFLHLLIIHSL